MSVNRFILLGHLCIGGWTQPIFVDVFEAAAAPMHAVFVDDPAKRFVSATAQLAAIIAKDHVSMLAPLNDPDLVTNLALSA